MLISSISTLSSLFFFLQATRSFVIGVVRDEHFIENNSLLRWNLFLAEDDVEMTELDLNHESNDWVTITAERECYQRDGRVSRERVKQIIFRGTLAVRLAPHL